MMAVTMQAQAQTAETTATLPASDVQVSGRKAYTLDQLKDSAMRNNIAMRNARHNIEAAESQRKEAFTKYFPNVSGTGLWYYAGKPMVDATVNPSEIITPEIGAAMSQMLPAEALAALSNPISISMMKSGAFGGITAMQPLFAGGQIVNGNRLAKVGEEISHLQLQLTENEVEKNVEQYFWQLVSLQEKTKTVAAVESLLNDIHKDVDVAVRAGVTLRNDLLQVELRQNEMESQKLKLQNGIFIVRQLLGQYACLTPDNNASAPYQSADVGGYAYSFDIVSPDVNAQVHALPYPVGEQSAVKQLPEYQLLTKQVDATRLQHKLEVGKNMPTLAVGAGYTAYRFSSNSSTLDAPKSNFPMLFATVSVPISDWWGGSHAIKRKKIAVMQAEEQLQDNAQLLTIRMQKAWRDVQEAQQQLDIAKRSIEQATENLRIHRNYYKAGTATMSDLLEAQMLYQQTCDKHTEAFINLQNKLLDYRFATPLSSLLFPR